MTLRFYTTVGCHLCDEAWEIIRPITKRRQLPVECVDIMDYPAAEALFAETIPVLEWVDQDRRLSWPFDAEMVYRFLT